MVKTEISELTCVWSGERTQPKGYRKYLLFALKVFTVSLNLSNDASNKIVWFLKQGTSSDVHATITMCHFKAGLLRFAT